jgi:hypothetical protein
MKGLLIKDFHILLKNSKIYLLAAVLVFLRFTTGENGFVFTYCGMLAGILVSSTLSYDEFDHGQPFLFSLPFTRKQYVMEKYLLALILLAGMMLIGIIIVGVGDLILHQSILAHSLEYLLAGLITGVIISAIMIPIRIKYGVEKGQQVMIAVMIAIIGIAFLLRTVLSEAALQNIGAFLDSVSPLVFILIFAGFIGGLVLISYQISLKVLLKKEF